MRGKGSPSTSGTEQAEVDLEDRLEETHVCSLVESTEMVGRKMHEQPSARGRNSSICSIDLALTPGVPTG